jgi:hypothetical protein
MVVTGAVTVNAVAGGAEDEVVKGGVSILTFFLSQERSANPSARSISCPRSRHTSIIY